MRQLEGPSRLAMRAVALVLPPELKLYIATFCTPSSLASLAQVHTSYQVHAERELYQNTAIYYTDSNFQDVVLDTLRNRPHKAGLVRSLTIELSPRSDTIDNDAEVFAATSLCDVLCSMHSLMDLRIRMPDYDGTPWAAQINQVLCAKNFKLQTLYCDQYLDIINIIVEQPELQLVGLYRGASYTSLIDTLYATLELNSPRPTLFVLDPSRIRLNFNCLYVFPEPSPGLLYPWTALTDSFDKDIARGVQLDRHSLSAVRIYLRDFSDMAFVQDVVGRMAQSFPYVTQLSFLTQFSPRMPHSYPDLLSLLSSIPLLSEVVFWYWRYLVGEDSDVISRDQQIALADEWARECRNLRVIRFLDGTTLTRSEGDQVWKIFGED